MTGRILCAGRGNKLTSPQPVWKENGRIYRYAPPGGVYHHGRTTGHFRNLQGDARFGLIIVEDYDVTALVDRVIPVEDALSNEFATRGELGHERAKDLVMLWSTKLADYGALLLKGEEPTEEEYQTAEARRRAYAERRLLRVMEGQRQRLQGTKGVKAGYDDSDRAWAAEYNIALDLTLQSLQGLAPLNAQAGNAAQAGGGVRTAEDTPCPFCQMPIAAKASKCRHCGSNFKEPLLDYLAKQATREEQENA